jgi:chromosome segregation ATPase
MATKNKNVWKMVQQTQAELRKTQDRIAELERTVNTAQPQNPTSSVNIQAQQEEIEAQTVIAEKAKRALGQAESEIDRLRVELRQSSDRKAVKDLEEKWATESAAHALTKEANNKLREEMGKLEGINKGLRELMEKRKEAHNEQLQ